MKLRIEWLPGVAMALSILVAGFGPAVPSEAQTPASDLFVRIEPGSESPPGQTPHNFPLIYHLIVSASGAPGSAVVVSDTLPAQMTFEAAEQVIGPVPFTITAPPVGSGGTVTFSVASLPVNRFAVFRIRGRFVPATPAGTVITNTATITGAGTDPNPGNNSFSRSTTVGTAVSPGSTFSFTTSMTQSTHTTPVTRNSTATDGERTRVTGLFNGATVFDQTVDAGQNSAAELALEEAARAALRNAAGPQAIISGPANLGTTRLAANSTTGPTNEFTSAVVEASATHVFGPATILIGTDQSETFFVPVGTINFNVHVHTSSFANAVTTLTSGFVNLTTLQFTATAAPQTVPQTFQNPGAVVAILGGIGNGTRNPTPVPPRPAAAAPATQNVAAMPQLRPPSTGDAGLIGS